MRLLLGLACLAACGLPVAACASVPESSPVPLPIIDADASQVAVYWITQRGGTVMRVAK